MRKTPAAVAALAFLTVTCGAGAGAASADSPPPTWTNERLLDCGGVTVVAYLTPAGFGSAFHVVGSTDVIKPKFVEVRRLGETAFRTTFDVPGFDRNSRDVVDCTYTDPAQLFVHFTGVRT